MVDGRVDEVAGCRIVLGGRRSGVARDRVWLPTLSAPTVPVKRSRGTIQESSSRTQGVPMAGIDLSTQFDKISDKAKIASDKLKAANNSTKERLQSDVTDARDRA